MTPPAGSNARRPIWIVTLIAAVGAACYGWMSWCAFVGVTWNDIRLAPAFALRHGWPLYPPLGGGPLSTWIYGPVGVLVNLPATFASSAVGAVQIAGLINGLTLIGPVAVIFFTSAELRRAGRATQSLALALGILLLPYFSLVYQVPDHTATALGLLACWCLAKPNSPNAAQSIFAALLCVAAIWAKQTALFLPPALVVFLLSVKARGACVRFVAWTVFLGALSLLVAVKIFGADGLWLNLVAIPGRLPWGGLGDKIIPRLPQLLEWVALPWALFGLWRGYGLMPARDTESGRLLRCAALVAICELPVGLAGLCKIGGEVHLINSAAYLFPALVLAWLARAQPPAGRALVVVVLALALHATEFGALPLRPDSARLELGERLARANPGQLWFPQNPLITFFSDGKIYHAEDGIVTRDLAGIGLRKADFQRHLPAQLRAVVYPVGTIDTSALQLLPDFNVRLTNGPWEIHQRRPVP